MRTPFSMLLVGMLFLTSAPAMTDSAPSSSKPDPGASAVLPMSRQFDFKSTINGRTYRVQVATPFVPAPQKGYAALYVLDGDGYFGTYSFAARMRALYGELQPAVVVGIGYPEAEGNIKTALERRQYDLTATRIDAKEAAQTGLSPDPAAFGGADAFLQVIEREIKPRVAAALPVDSSREILFGHSLGGLFVLHTLFSHPDSFDTYLALSPSIWFNRRSVLDREPTFAAAVKSGKISPKVLIGVGGDEQSPPTGPLPPGMTREQVVASLSMAAMVSNAMDLGARLKALPGADGYTAHAQTFAGETHISVGWAAVGPLLEFALAPEPSESAQSLPRGDAPTPESGSSGVSFPKDPADEAQQTTANVVAYLNCACLFIEESTPERCSADLPPGMNKIVAVVDKERRSIDVTLGRWTAHAQDRGPSLGCRLR